MNTHVPSLEDIRSKAAIGRIVRRHYGLNRPVTEAETQAEIANLKRKYAKGTLDDMDERLYAALSVAGVDMEETL